MDLMIEYEVMSIDMRFLKCDDNISYHEVIGSVNKA